MDRGGSGVGWWQRVSTAQSMEGLREDIFPGIGGSELEQDAAHADSDDGADLEQLEPDRIDLRLGPLSAFEAEPAQRLD